VTCRSSTRSAATRSGWTALMTLGSPITVCSRPGDIQSGGGPASSPDARWITGQNIQATGGLNF
jgi:hypothetical protein